jgi:hypothetical protein
MKIPGP